MKRRSLREKVFAYAKQKYKSEPEYLWASAPNYAVLRHDDNRKWYAIVMDVQRTKLGLSGEERVDILNVKMDDPFFKDLLIQQEGFLDGYHIGKGNWISILLDGSVPPERIYALLGISYKTTASRQQKQRIRPAKEWLIPANPRYYDIAQAFSAADTIDWKHYRGIKKGDVVFIYLGAPQSAILYQCQVVATDIPCNYRDENLTISRLMKIKLVKQYAPDAFTLKKLKAQYGVYSVRGPRGVPQPLSKALSEQ